MATAPARNFAPFHKWDRNFFLILLVAIWIAILGGFGLDMVRRAMAGNLSFPWIVHAHALAFTGWLLLFAAQVLLARTRNYALHKKLGITSLFLIPAMLVLGPATVISLNAADPKIAPGQLSFMSTQLTNVFGCAVLLIAGLLSRRNGPQHKRLMLMGTIAITEPGFSRMLFGPLYGLMGEGYLPYYFETYPGTLALMLAVGGYDYATRRRFHPAWIAAFFWILANQIAATWLYYQPFWLHWMQALTGH